MGLEPGEGRRIEALARLHLDGRENLAALEEEIDLNRVLAHRPVVQLVVEGWMERLVGTEQLRHQALQEASLLLW